MSEKKLVEFKDLAIGEKFSFGCELEWYIKVTSDHCQSQYGDVDEPFDVRQPVVRRKAFYTYGAKKNITFVEEKKVTKEMIENWTYTAARLLTKEQLKMCAACAESDPRYAAVVQGIPVALCDEDCYEMLRANWR